MTHYERLGISTAATPEQVRTAYRRAARGAHPDRHGDGSSHAMAEVNEAWRVLGDPERRRAYDHELAALDEHAARSTPAAGRSTTPNRADSLRPDVTMTPTYAPARFPWRFILAMAAAGIAVVLIGHAFTEPGQPALPDGVLTSGSCVALGLDAVEVACDGDQDAVVDQLVPFDRTCRTGTESFRDRQGMGIACVVRSVPGG